MADGENMNIKVFSYRKPFPLLLFLGRMAIPTDQMELEIQDWLAKNPRIKVHELRHDLVQVGILTSAQLVVSIYYTDAEL
jgi:hypothetical protein